MSDSSLRKSGIWRLTPASPGTLPVRRISERDPGVRYDCDQAFQFQHLKRLENGAFDLQAEEARFRVE